MAAPFGARGAAHRRPRWAFDNRPGNLKVPCREPSDFVVKKRSKMPLRTAGSTPAQVSSTEISTLPGPASTLFMIKFDNTCCN